MTDLRSDFKYIDIDYEFPFYSARTFSKRGLKSTAVDCKNENVGIQKLNSSLPPHFSNVQIFAVSVEETTRQGRKVS